MDATPTASYRDAPAWTEDPATLGYIRTCQGTKAGDPINPLYTERITAAALVAEAIEAYDAGRYQQSLDLYTNAQRTIAAGMGSRQTMVGSGRDDASDALDRRVEFKVIGC